MSEDEEKRRTQRRHVLHEIINTERSYVQDLDHIIEVPLTVVLCNVDRFIFAL